MRPDQSSVSGKLNFTRQTISPRDTCGNERRRVSGSKGGGGGGGGGLLEVQLSIRRLCIQRHVDAYRQNLREFAGVPFGAH